MYIFLLFIFNHTESYVFTEDLDYKLYIEHRNRFFFQSDVVYDNFKLISSLSDTKLIGLY